MNKIVRVDTQKLAKWLCCRHETVCYVCCQKVHATAMNFRQLNLFTCASRVSFLYILTKFVETIRQGSNKTPVFGQSLCGSDRWGSSPTHDNVFHFLQRIYYVFLLPLRFEKSDKLNVQMCNISVLSDLVILVILGPFKTSPSRYTFQVSSNLFTFLSLTPGDAWRTCW